MDHHDKARPHARQRIKRPDIFVEAFPAAAILGARLLG